MTGEQQMLKAEETETPLSALADRPGAPSVLVCPAQGGRLTVQRDMGLIREILLSVRQRTDAVPRPVEIDGYPEAVLVRHVEMLLDAGLLEGIKKVSGAGGLPHILIKDMSNAGHDFIEAMTNNAVWSQLKQKLTPGELAAIPLQVIASVASKVFERWAAERLGL